MARLKITKRKVQLLLTGPKDILPSPVQETINVNMTFYDLLDKVINQIDELPSGLIISRTSGGYSSENSVSLSCRIKDFLETRYKREMTIYRIRLFHQKSARKSGLCRHNMKARVAQRRSPRFAAAAPNENPENDTRPSQEPGEVGPLSEGLDESIVTTTEGPADLMAPASSQEGSIVGAAPNEDTKKMVAIVPGKISGGNGVLPEAVVVLDRVSVSGAVPLQKDDPEVEIETGSPQDTSQVVSIEDEYKDNSQAPVGVNVLGKNTNATADVSTCSTLDQLQQLMDECTNASAMIRKISQEIMPPPDILVPPSSLRSSPESSVVSVPLKSELANWETESVLEDMRQEGVQIVDLKTQSHRRLAGISNTLLLLALEEKRKLKEKWQSLYGRAPVCARLLEELLKE